MKPSLEKLESPFLEGELLNRPTREGFHQLPQVVDESPFASASFSSQALDEPREIDAEDPLEEEEERLSDYLLSDADLTAKEIGIIGGRDDREPIANSVAVPFRWICRIWIQSRIKFESGRERKTGLAPLATGVLITPRHVLTAAHVLHGVKKRGSVTEEHEAFHVEVAPGANGDRTPFGRIKASSWKLAEHWKPGDASQWDYALIKLEDPVGDQTFAELNNEALCFWGSSKCGSNTSIAGVPRDLLKSLIGKRVVTAGYPAIGDGTLYCAAGLYSAGAQSGHLIKQGVVEAWVTRTGTFFVTADASEGQSGSPVWIVNNQTRHMVGILAAIGEEYNTVVNLRDRVIQEVSSWIAQK